MRRPYGVKKEVVVYIDSESQSHEVERHGGAGRGVKSSYSEERVKSSPSKASIRNTTRKSNGCKRQDSYSDVPAISKGIESSRERQRQNAEHLLRRGKQTLGGPAKSPNTRDMWKAGNVL